MRTRPRSHEAPRARELPLLRRSDFMRYSLTAPPAERSSGLRGSAPPCPSRGRGRRASRRPAESGRVPAQMWQGWTQSRRRCGTRCAQSRRRCGRGAPGPGADVAGVGPVPAQAQPWAGAALMPVAVKSVANVVSCVATPRCPDTGRAESRRSQTLYYRCDSVVALRRVVLRDGAHGPASPCRACRDGT